MKVALSRVLAAALALLPLSFADAASRPPVRARQGMVVSASPIASEVGVAILKKGGNAVDAAVAVGFTLAVTYPSAGNLGGGGFMVLHLAGSGKQVAIDYRETAPQKAHRDMFLDDKNEVVPELSTIGHLSAAVPGSVAGLLLALEKYGRLDRRAVLEPAIRLAEVGFPVSDVLADSLRRAATRLGRFSESKRVFLREGRYFEEVEILVQKDLGATLRRIAEQGAGGFYEGPVARLIAEEMRRGGGLISEDDLKRYRPVEREPVRGTYRGHTVVSMPPSSSGGTILIEMLNMVEPMDLAALGHNSSAYLHVLAEVMKRAYADRAQFMGDADFTSVPVRGLTSKAYAERRGRGIDPARATPSGELGAGDPLAFESFETTHFSVMDSEGGAVSNTYTLNAGYGSGVSVTGAGFLLNDNMDNFASKRGAPNAYGLIQAEANLIGPGKRPLSSMSPTIVLREGKVLLVAGTPGGPTITNTVFQVLLNVLDHHFDVQQAVDAARIHHQWLPDEIRFEKGGLVRDVEEALKARGHALKAQELIGDAHSIYVDPETGVRMGGADPRRGGRAIGY